MNQPASDDGYRTRSALRLVGLVGLIVSGGILTGTWIGFKLDDYFGGSGTITAVGVLFGVVVGLGLAVRLLLREMPGPPD
jgi:hypothetical protein